MVNKVFLQDVNDFLESFESNSIDLIIADPPYNIGIDKWDKFETQEKYWNFMHKWLDNAVKKLKIGGSIYIFNNQFNSAITLNYLSDKLQFNNWITWFKKDGFHPTKTKFVNNQETCLFMSKGKPSVFNYEKIRVPYLSIERLMSGKGVKGKNGLYWKPNPNGKLCGDVWEFSSERHNKKNKGKTVKLSHPTIKPYELIKRIIIASSNADSLVVDLFSGSGQTTLVSKELGIKSLGCEIDKKYYLEICKKICKN